MPELPEVEHLRRTLEPRIVGARVVAVDLRRRDVLRDGAGRRRGKINSADLLAGTRITQLARHGKNLAIVGDSGRVICIHLGMSGQMFVRSASPSTPPRRKMQRDHIHCTWRLQTEHGDLELVFRDPRRFGGIWTFYSSDLLHRQRLCKLGPDALTINAAHLQRTLAGSDRAIKAALLDQRALAGVGNIYADEALFAAGIHPRSRGRSIPAGLVGSLAQAIRSVLGSAIKAGGSSIRDYVDGNGSLGEFTIQHQVYGRGGEPCALCGRRLRQSQIAQRTTVYCPKCQRIYR